MQASDPIAIALFRSLLGAVLLGASAFFTTYAVTDTECKPATATDPGDDECSWKPVIVSTGSAAVGFLIVRGGFEGVYDQRRKPNQNIPPASELDDPPAR